MVSRVALSEQEARDIAHWWFHAGGALSRALAKNLPSSAEDLFDAMQAVVHNSDSADEEYHKLFALWWSEREAGEM